MSVKNYRSIFLFFVLLCLALRIYIIWLNVWPINGDEAQYWSWAKHLAWGYYSKPPMVAWMIAATTHFFGNGPIGLRVAVPIAYSITSLFIYAAGKKLFNETTGFWSGIMFLLIPGVTFSSTIISTDPFLLMFWAIAFWGLLYALETKSSKWWLFASIALGLSYYSKYAAVLFPLSLFLYLILSNENRQLLKTPGPYIILFVPLLMLIPNLYWNLQNHFSSIMAVKNNADLSHGLFHFASLFDFLGAQFAVFGPILFTSLIVFLFVCKRYLKQEKYLLLFCFAFLTLLIMTLESFLSRAHANWSAPAYITGTILAVAFILDYKQKFWLWLTLVLNIMIAISFANIQNIIRYVHAPMDKEMTIISWPKAANSIDQLREKYPTTKFLFDRRMLLTQIMYFAHVPLQDVFTWNPQGVIRSQYDLVTDLKPEVGRNFIFLAYHPNQANIFTHFQFVKQEKTILLVTIDGKILPLYVYYLQDFKGYQ